MSDNKTSTCRNCEQAIELTKIPYGGFEWQHTSCNEAECPQIEGCYAEPEMTFEEWLAYGVRLGFCTEQYCETHEGSPMTEEEQQEFDEGGDPCIHVVRLGSEEDWS
jgi:hypothetical protein